MTIHKHSDAFEDYRYDDATGTGTVTRRANSPPWDRSPDALDDHFLGARLQGPLKPWIDAGKSTHLASSSGSVHAVVIEAAAPYPEVAASLLTNANADLARPIHFPGLGQVCQGGGLPPCSTSIPVFAWCPCHEFRAIRHIMVYRRWGWPSERFLAETAIERIISEPTIFSGKSNNQRYYGWPLLTLANALPILPNSHPLRERVNLAIRRITDILWGKKGENYYTLNTAAGADHDSPDDPDVKGEPVCSWQHSLLVDACDMLTRAKWNDDRVPALYKIGMRGLDAMKQEPDNTWVKDWNPQTGVVFKAISKYQGTALWDACAYARSLDILTAGADERREYLREFMSRSNGLKPTDSGYDAASHALLAALVD